MFSSKDSITAATSSAPSDQLMRQQDQRRHGRVAAANPPNRAPCGLARRRRSQTCRKVDLTGSQLSARRLPSIEQLGMGTNAKNHLQLDRRPYKIAKWSGGMTSSAASPASQTPGTTSHGSTRGSTIPGCTATGYNVRRVAGDDDVFGGYQAILFQAAHGLKPPPEWVTKGDPPVIGVYRAASDFRKDGQAGGW
jgi:hypothetical protein